jgi:hypothetical protein
MAGPAGDICDLYAFPSPERPGHLVLALTVLPIAMPTALFSDAICCRFRLRPLTIAATGAATAFTFAGEKEEIAFDFHFAAPQPGNNGALLQTGRCLSPFAPPVEFTVNDKRGGQAAGLRVYAGLRSDPFFLDLPAFMETVATGRMVLKAVGDNFSYGQNVLGIVMEVDCTPLLAAGKGSLVAVVGETVAAGKLPIRIERVGRPEVKNFILSWKEHDLVNRDFEVRDIYNLEDAFHMSKDYRSAYRARFNANLAYFDNIDGKIDWPLDDQGMHPLTKLLLADYLVVDLAKPYNEASYFEIEQALLQGKTHTTCGGRSPNDDIMDTLSTLLINANRGPRISDGVDQATTPAALTFPYLMPPNPPEMMKLPPPPPNMLDGEEDHEH